MELGGGKRQLESTCIPMHCVCVCVCVCVYFSLSIPAALSHSIYSSGRENVCMCVQVGGGDMTASPFTAINNSLLFLPPHLSSTQHLTSPLPP